MTIFLPLLLLAATDGADRPPPGIEALRHEQGEDGPGCTADRRWCVEIDAKGELQVSNGRLRAGESSYPLTLLSQGEEGTSTLWPHAISFGDGMLAGIETRTETGYRFSALRVTAGLEGKFPIGKIPGLHLAGTLKFPVRENYDCIKTKER